MSRQTTDRPGPVRTDGAQLRHGLTGLDAGSGTGTSHEELVEEMLDAKLGAEAADESASDQALGPHVDRDESA